MLLKFLNAVSGSFIFCDASRVRNAEFSDRVAAARTVAGLFERQYLRCELVSSSRSPGPRTESNGSLPLHPLSPHSSCRLAARVLDTDLQTTTGSLLLPDCCRLQALLPYDKPAATAAGEWRNYVATKLGAFRSMKLNTRDGVAQTAAGHTGVTTAINPLPHALLWKQVHQHMDNSSSHGHLLKFHRLTITVNRPSREVRENSKQRTFAFWHGHLVSHATFESFNTYTDISGYNNWKK
jgi:hypothetical protein